MELVQGTGMGKEARTHCTINVQIGYVSLLIILPFPPQYHSTTLRCLLPINSPVALVASRRTAEPCGLLGGKELRPDGSACHIQRALRTGQGSEQLWHTFLDLLKQIPRQLSAERPHSPDRGRVRTPAPHSPSRATQQTGLGDLESNQSRQVTHTLRLSDCITIH